MLHTYNILYKNNVAYLQYTFIKSGTEIEHKLFTSRKIILVIIKVLYSCQLVLK